MPVILLIERVAHDAVRTAERGSWKKHRLFPDCDRRQHTEWYKNSHFVSFTIGLTLKIAQKFPARSPAYRWMQDSHFTWSAYAHYLVMLGDKNCKKNSVSSRNCISGNLPTHCEADRMLRSISCRREAATICSTPVTLTFDLLTLKVVSELHVTWDTSVPILVFLGISVLD